MALSIMCLLIPPSSARPTWCSDDASVLQRPYHQHKQQLLQHIIYYYDNMLPKMTKTTTPPSKKQVRFHNRTTVIVVRRLSHNPMQAQKLWYSQEETDLFHVRHSHRVRAVRSQLQSLSSALDEEGVIINAAAILGLEKYLSPELTAEYKERRSALERVVLEQHRIHRALNIQNDAARLAVVSEKYSQWARERARTAALFLEQDVLQDSRDMNLQVKAPRRCSLQGNNTTETDDVRKETPCKRRSSFVSLRSLRHDGNF
jgi:hypothetical protein